jgi:hypothetical protein
MKPRIRCSASTASVSLRAERRLTRVCVRARVLVHLHARARARVCVGRWM